MGLTLQLEPPTMAPPPTQPPTVAARHGRRAAQEHATPPPRRGDSSKIVVPIRYSAWLTGDLGRVFERTLASALGALEGVRITRMERAVLVEAREEPGPLVEMMHRGLLDLEEGMATAYPALHHQLGPLWTGTLQCVFC